MLRYNPLKPPPADQWNALDEEERVLAVEQYHKRAGIKLPNLDLHSSFHCTIEDQIALGDEIPIAKEFDRLMREGLDRHEAIHAMATVLVEHLNYLCSPEGKKDKRTSEQMNAWYYQKAREWTAEKWLTMMDEE